MSAGGPGGGGRGGVSGPSAEPCVRSSAVDSRSGAKVAIKKLYRPFQSELYAKRAYRELRLLKHMRHENVSAGRPHGASCSATSGPRPAPPSGPGGTPCGGRR